MKTPRLTKQLFFRLMDLYKTGSHRIKEEGGYDTGTLWVVDGKPKDLRNWPRSVDGYIVGSLHFCTPSLRATRAEVFGDGRGLHGRSLEDYFARCEARGKMYARWMSEYSGKAAKPEGSPVRHRRPAVDG